MGKRSKYLFFLVKVQVCYQEYNFAISCEYLPDSVFADRMDIRINHGRHFDGFQDALSRMEVNLLYAIKTGF